MNSAEVAKSILTRKNIVLALSVGMLASSCFSFVEGSKDYFEAEAAIATSPQGLQASRLALVDSQISCATSKLFSAQKNFFDAEVRAQPAWALDCFRNSEIRLPELDLILQEIRQKAAATPPDRIGAYKPEIKNLESLAELIRQKRQEVLRETPASVRNRSVSSSAAVGMSLPVLVMALTGLGYSLLSDDRRRDSGT